MKDLVEYIAKALVNDPSQVEVTERQVGGTLLVELRVASEDMGRVIGKHGKIINAMRALVEVAALQADQRVQLEVLD